MKHYLIYGATSERAVIKLKEIAEMLVHKGELQHAQYSRERGGLIARNGDVYTACMANDGVRGYRWQYAYVDHKIDYDLLQCVVLPKGMPNEDMRLLGEKVDWEFFGVKENT